MLDYRTPRHTSAYGMYVLYMPGGFVHGPSGPANQRARPLQKTHVNIHRHVSMYLHTYVHALHTYALHHARPCMQPYAWKGRPPTPARNPTRRASGMKQVTPSRRSARVMSCSESRSCERARLKIGRQQKKILGNSALCNHMTNEKITRCTFSFYLSFALYLCEGHDGDTRRERYSCGGWRSRQRHDTMRTPEVSPRGFCWLAVSRQVSCWSALYVSLLLLLPPTRRPHQ